MRTLIDKINFHTLLTLLSVPNILSMELVRRVMKNVAINKIQVGKIMLTSLINALERHPKIDQVLQ